MKPKRLDESHLTPEEKNEVLKFGTVATVLIAVGAMFGAFHWLNETAALGVVFVGCIIVAFLWGYVGSLENERSKKDG